MENEITGIQRRERQMTQELEDVDPQERFQEFFKIEKYRQKIAQLAITNKKSLIVDFEELLAFDQKLAENILEKPDEYLKHANNAAYDQLRIEDPEYAEKIVRKAESVTVRIVKLWQATRLRKLGSNHIGKLVMVEGIVVRSTPVRPMVMQAAFKCKRCGEITHVNQTGQFLRAPFACSNPTCRAKGPFDFIQEDSTFIDSQDIRMQERPEDLPPGQLPRTLHVKLVGSEIVDIARPGDHVSIVGIVRAVSPTLPRVGKLRSFILHLDANSIEVLGKEPEIAIPSPEEEEKILELAKDPWIHRKIINSIAPSIYGYDHIKEAIMYLLFGGVPKSLPDISIRGEINALLIGDPGTAKSQLLQYVARVAPRGLYTSGRGTTAAGLTAAVIREKGGGMTLEAGALVLADKGIACIDEMDKMRPEDRVAIHEAMEQHTVSVAKGGIVATLNARTAILAAANPALGRYEPYRTVTENISLPVTILSRFDLIFVLRDVPNKETDSKMSEHILEMHRKGLSPVEPPIPLELLRKYISYARGIKPVLTTEALQRLRDFYLAMRSVSESEDSPVAITARQLESLVRIAEARARAALRKEVTAEDAEAAINLMKRSLKEVGIDMTSEKYDIDLIMTGKPKSVRDKLHAVISTLLEIEKETGIVERTALLNELEARYKIPRGEAERLIKQLLREGTVYEPREGYLKKT
jgi:replicative DNA helicase Mcm